jgi:hypothetical protein
VELTAADFDGDGATDLAALGFPRYSLQVAVARGKGNGRFRPVTTFDAGIGERGGTGLVAGDFNHDLRPDIAVASTSVEEMEPGPAFLDILINAS